MFRPVVKGDCVSLMFKDVFPQRLLGRLVYEYKQVEG